MTQELAFRIIMMVIIPFIFVALIIPFVKKIADHVGALDIPNERKIHKKPMPRLGGLGIFFGFLMGYMIYGEQTSIMNSILIGSFIVVLFGVMDDIKPLKASTKFLGQLASAMILTFYGGIILQDISAFGLYLNFGIFSYPITIFFVLGCINCVNFIDGVDGLSAGISSIFFLSIGIIATARLEFGLAFTLTFIMFGSSLGFLVHNFHPAKIFMGDSGSMFLGFIISAITLLGFKNVMMSSIIIPLLILAVPILDTMFAIIRRKLKNESISKPDKFHIHHQLLNRNFSQRATVLIIYFVTILFSSASIIYVIVDNNLGYIIYGILLFVVIIFVMKTNVVFPKNEVSKKKVLFISSTGGHLNELLQLKELFSEYDYSLITEKTLSTKSLKNKYNNVHYLVYGTRQHLFVYIFKYCFNCLKSLYLFFKLKPDVVVTTGTHTAVFMCYLAFIFRKKVIYIETFANSETKTLAGRLVYPIATHFIVQWESMLKLYPKAIYGGWIY